MRSVAVRASRGKSFVPRKCVFGLRLLAEPATADVQVRYGDVVDDDDVDNGDEDVAVDDDGSAGEGDIVDDVGDVADEGNDDEPSSTATSPTSPTSSSP